MVDDRRDLFGVSFKGGNNLLLPTVKHHHVLIRTTWREHVKILSLWQRIESLFLRTKCRQHAVTQGIVRDVYLTTRAHRRHTFELCESDDVIKLCLCNRVVTVPVRTLLESVGQRSSERIPGILAL